MTYENMLPLVYFRIFMLIASRVFYKDNDSVDATSEVFRCDIFNAFLSLLLQ